MLLADGSLCLLVNQRACRLANALYVATRRPAAAPRGPSLIFSPAQPGAFSHLSFGERGVTLGRFTRGGCRDCRLGAVVVGPPIHFLGAPGGLQNVLQAGVRARALVVMLEHGGAALEHERPALLQPLVRLWWEPCESKGRP